MSFNLVDLIKDQVTDVVVEKAGGLLGGDSAKAASGIESAIPALLGGLTGAADSPAKAGVLFDTINKTDDSVLTNFADVLGGSNSGKMLEQGSSVLTGLMGSDMVGKLGSAVSSATGMSGGGSGSLMSMLVPPVLGVLKKKVVDGGLDAGGLMSMLDGQKANIANAMPSNLASQLGGIDGFPSLSGIADGVKDMAGNVSDAASDAVGSATAGLGTVADKVGDVAGDAVDSVQSGINSGIDKVGDAAQHGVDAVSGAAGQVGDVAQRGVDAVGDIAQGSVDAAQNAAGKIGNAAQHGVDTAGSSGGGLFKWLIPLFIALGLGWLAYTFLGKKDVDVDDAASGAATAVQQTASGTVGDVNVGELTGSVTGLFDKASETLSGITDADSATAALPGLKELGGQVSGLPAMFNKVPEAARGPLQGAVSQGLGSLQPMIDKVMAIPGVGGILEPVLNPILETLGGLGG